MEKTANISNLLAIQKVLFTLDDNHSNTQLNLLKKELNRFFIKAKCTNVIYTENTDKLFFGMRVYPCISPDKAVDIVTNDEVTPFTTYAVEFDSKLYDPMMGLTEREILAVLLHEIGHIVYDTSTIDEVKKSVDLYLADTSDYISTKTSNRDFNSVLAYGLKDAMFKQASLFAKFGNEEMIADTFVFSCGYGEDLETAFKKILHSSMFINKDVDDRFIMLSWALRLNKNIRFTRLQSIKTLNKAKQLCASRLEKEAIADTVDSLRKIKDDNINESGLIDNVKERFHKKFANFKAKGIRSIKTDIYELNLRLRVAETEEDLLYIIRTINSDIAILQDYLTEPDVDDQERQDVENVLQELYSIRQKAAKDKEVRAKYGSMIQVVYPDLS